jgi:hypothetical protein
MIGGENFAAGLVIFPNPIMRHIAVQGFLRGTRIALVSAGERCAIMRREKNEKSDENFIGGRRFGSESCGGRGGCPNSVA